MNEDKELYNDVALYIQSIYKNINDILTVVYSQMNINVTYLQNLYIDLNNLVDYAGVLTQKSGLNFDTQLLEEGIENYMKANKTSNYLLLADTLEYEVIPAISNYYDTIVDNLL